MIVKNTERSFAKQRFGIIQKRLGGNDGSIMSNSLTIKREQSQNRK